MDLYAEVFQYKIFLPIQHSALFFLYFFIQPVFIEFLDVEDTAMNHTGRNLCPHETCFLVCVKGDMQYNNLQTTSRDCTDCDK